MVIIDAEGLFGGDRLRRCSNAAQLHWPRLLLASNGFGRLEINYPRIIGRAYATFVPVPSEAEIQDYLEEYARNFLLFLYPADGQLWGQWDTRTELLPRYKTAADRRSPIPPEPAFTEWRRRYRDEAKALPKCFGNISEKFHADAHVVVGVGVDVVDKNTDLDYLPTNHKKRDSRSGAASPLPSKEERYPRLRDALHCFMEEPGQEDIWPSDRVVVDVMDAACGATEDEVIACLRYLRDERDLKPGTRNGPRHWSWFKSTVGDYFRQRRVREDVSNPAA